MVGELLWLKSNSSLHMAQIHHAFTQPTQCLWQLWCDQQSSSRSLSPLAARSGSRLSKCLLWCSPLQSMPTGTWGRRHSFGGSPPLPLRNLQIQIKVCAQEQRRTGRAWQKAAWTGAQRDGMTMESSPLTFLLSASLPQQAFAPPTWSNSCACSCCTYQSLTRLARQLSRWANKHVAHVTSSNVSNNWTLPGIGSPLSSWALTLVIAKTDHQPCFDRDFQHESSWKAPQRLWNQAYTLPRAGPEHHRSGQHATEDAGG